jgi:hypothetical protein
VHVAQSLVYPFRRGSLGAWLAGIPLLLFFPLSFVVVLGYAVRATREAALSPQAPPPGFSLDGRLLRDGLLLTVVFLLVVVPYLLMSDAVAGAVFARMPAGTDPLIGPAEALLFGGFLVAIPWGTVVLLLVPPAVAAFAASGRARDLFNVARALRLVRTHFMAWNLATVAIVTAWIVALAGAGLLCVGFLPGAFYAILVSAHATASLVADPETRGQAAPAR